MTSIYQKIQCQAYKAFISPQLHHFLMDVYCMVSCEFTVIPCRVRPHQFLHQEAGSKASLHGRDQGLRCLFPTSLIKHTFNSSSHTLSLVYNPSQGGTQHFSKLGTSFTLFHVPSTLVVGRTCYGQSPNRQKVGCSRTMDSAEVFGQSLTAAPILCPLAAVKRAWNPFS